MSAKNRVGRDNGRNLPQTPTTETRAESGQAPPFVVDEQHALAAQLGFRNPVLFAQVLDDLVLFVLEPADKKRDEQVQRNHASSLRQLPGEVFGHYLRARWPRPECCRRQGGVGSRRILSQSVIKNPTMSSVATARP